MAQRIKTVVDSVLSGLLGDAEHAEAGRPVLMLDLLSDWLPYRVYDPANRLYLNARSEGFVLSVTPLIGADSVPLAAIRRITQICLAESLRESPERCATSLYLMQRPRL